MINLLREQISREEIAQMLHAELHPALPPFYSETWRHVRAIPYVSRWLETLRETADREQPSIIAEALPMGAGAPLTNTTFYEQRARLARASIIALLAGETEQSDRLATLATLLDEYLEEPNWSLPREASSQPGERATIDVPAAETANGIAEVVALFRDVLPSDLVNDATARLRKEFFELYLATHEELWWTKVTGSANAASHQGVLGAALTILDDPELLAGLLHAARRYLALYLRGFGNDGACPEGPGYWHYGFGRFCILNDQLEARSSQRLSLISGDAKIQRIARYGPRVTLASDRVVNFGDTQSASPLSPALLRYLGKRLNDRHCHQAATLAYHRLEESGITQPGQPYDFTGLSRLLLYAAEPAPPVTAEPGLDHFFGDVQVIVSRGIDDAGHLWEWAAKGGNNAEAHNHNDCGSYLLHLDGVPVAVEIGAPEFSRDYLREGRYHYLAARTMGHSLPIVNGHEQSAGPQYKARVLAADLIGGTAEFSLDLTDCYPSSAGCHELVRTFRFERGAGCFRVGDLYDLDSFESFETAVICESEPILSEAEALIPAGGRTMFLVPDEGTVFAGFERHEYRTQKGVSRAVFRILLKPAGSATSGTIGYRFTLLHSQSM
jgi:hypothetical protein